MARCVWPFALGLGLLALAGCGLNEPRPQRPAWRTQAENACLAEKLVQATAYTQPAREIDGPGICGMTHPFKVSALLDGQVALRPQQTMDCSLTAAINGWINEVVQPIAQQRFGQAVVEVDSMGSYGCRPINHRSGASLSEHAFGNAIDIGGFRLADGREISVVRGWTRGDPQEQAFLREVHAGACNQFTTVLGPGSDALHYNHIHVDLAHHGNTSAGPRRICKPTPAPQLLPAPGPRQDDLPDPPMIDEDIDIARAPGASPVLAMQRAAPTLAAPPPYGSALPLPSSQPPFAQQAQRLAPMSPPQTLRVPPPLALAPVAAPPARAKRPATLRSDGVFVPEGDTADFDVTSSIRKK